LQVDWLQQIPIVSGRRDLKTHEISLSIKLIFYLRTSETRKSRQEEKEKTQSGISILYCIIMLLWGSNKGA
jgi:hypothetical protein